MVWPATSTIVDADVVAGRLEFPVQRASPCHREQVEHGVALMPIELKTSKWRLGSTSVWPWQ